MIFSKWVFRQTILEIILNKNSLTTSTYFEKKKKSLRKGILQILLLLFSSGSW